MILNNISVYIWATNHASIMLEISRSEYLRKKKSGCGCKGVGGVNRSVLVLYSVIPLHSGSKLSN